MCHQYGVDSNPMKYRDLGFFSSYQRKRKDYPGPGFSYFTNDSMTRWIVDRSQGFTKPDLLMISESVRAYAYLVLSSQASARSSIVGNDASVVNLRVDIQQDIKQYQDMLNYASSKVDYSVGQGIYMLPSDMDLNIKTGVAGYNSKILISDPSLDLGINKKINEGSSLTNATRTSTKGLQELPRGQQELPKGSELPSEGRALKPDHELNPTVSSHEEEKIALILFLTTSFSIWHMFR